MFHFGGCVLVGGRGFNDGNDDDGIIQFERLF